MDEQLPAQKSILRAKHRIGRQAISSEDRLQWDGAVTQTVLSLPVLAYARKVFVYLSRNGEVSTRSIVETLLQQQKVVLTPSPDIKALPHDGLFKICSNSDQVNLMGPVLCRESRADEIDVVLVPGIVWDREGYRIGFGGGYFDRLLEMVRPDCLKIGLSYDGQLEHEVPREPWDQAVDILVTPTAVYRK